MGSHTERQVADFSKGYERVAGKFMARARRVNASVGFATVRTWAGALCPGAAILDLGCGHGVPISQALIEDGFAVYGIDASPTMVAAFRKRFPQSHIVCEAVEHSCFCDRTFDGVVAWGLMFLLSANAQSALIPRIAAALNHGGRFLFTSPEQPCTWADLLTGRHSLTLGAEVYKANLLAAGLTPTGEYRDEGDNHYYEALKP